MKTSQKVSLFLLRVSIGWLFFYSGVTKIANPEWSAAGFLNNAKTFQEFFSFFAQPEILPLVNILNSWGQMLIGAALLLGIFVRLASFSGVLLMILYYLPILQFPYPNQSSFIIDQHIIYAAALLVLATLKAGKAWGLQKRLFQLQFFSRHPRIKSVLD